MAYKAVLQGQHIQYHLNLCASDIDSCDPWRKNQFHSILQGCYIYKISILIIVIIISYILYSIYTT